MVRPGKSTTLGELRLSSYKSLPVREEIRHNLISTLRARKPIFPGIIGYEHTVVPQIENAILAGHDIIFLGERGQAKSRIMRSLVSLLDEEIPVIKGCEINDDPFAPVCKHCRDLVAAKGDATPIAWLPRDLRYGEKLATPDTAIADLIGDVDPVKVAEGKYLADELTIHYGLIPRANRGIFAINELPDLAERLQVGLFNLMEERDIQIRGYNIRLPLDVFLIASANPEDYTNRGRIITPLKDRYGAQIRTHYPATSGEELAIVEMERKKFAGDEVDTYVPPFMKEIIAEVTQLARKSSDISQTSGVSVRVSIANYETALANAVRRAIMLGEKLAVPRISDLPYIHASTAGKIELESFEDNKESRVISDLAKRAVLNVFNRHYQLPKFDALMVPFEQGVAVEVSDMMENKVYLSTMKSVPGLEAMVRTIEKSERPEAVASAMEFILEGLYVNKKLNKSRVQDRIVYRH